MQIPVHIILDDSCLNLDLSKLEFKLIISRVNNYLEETRNLLKLEYNLEEITTSRYFGYKNTKESKKYLIILEELKEKIKVSINKNYSPLDGETSTRFNYVDSFLISPENLKNFVEGAFLYDKS